MSAFSSDVLANLIGSAFGVGLALAIDRLNERRHEKMRDRDALRSRASREAAQFSIVKWLVEENLELARQALAAFDQDGVFFFRMNTHLMDSALVELASLTDDKTLLWRPAPAATSRRGLTPAASPACCNR